MGHIGLGNHYVTMKTILNIHFGGPNILTHTHTHMYHSASQLQDWPPTQNPLCAHLWFFVCNSAQPNSGMHSSVLKQFWWDPEFCAIPKVYLLNWDPVKFHQMFQVGQLQWNKYHSPATCPITLVGEAVNSVFVGCNCLVIWSYSNCNQSPSRIWSQIQNWFIHPSLVSLVLTISP